MTMYTAAVIGSGMIANEGHIPACLAMNERVNLRAVCGRNPDTVAQTAKRYGIPGSYTDVEEMLEKVKPDIVSVCTPNQTHAQYVSMALKAGCHVLCEKPVGLNSAEVKALYALAEKQNRLLIACQTLRFQPEWMQARKLVQSGELGEIIAAGFDRIRSRGIPTWGGFHRKAVSGGGAMADIGVHLLDGLLWMLGNPKVVSVTGFASDQLTKANPDLCCPTESSGAGTAQVSNAGYQGEQFDVEEYAVGIARLETGVPISFQAAWAANLPEQTHIRILGTKASLLVPEMQMHDGTRSWLLSERRPVPRYGGTFSGHKYLLEHVLDVLDGNARLLITPEESINVSTALELFYRSSEQHREVSLSEL